MALGILSLLSALGKWYDIGSCFTEFDIPNTMYDKEKTLAEIRRVKSFKCYRVSATGSSAWFMVNGKGLCVHQKFLTLSAVQPPSKVCWEVVQRVERTVKVLATTKGEAAEMVNTEINRTGLNASDPGWTIRTLSPKQIDQIPDIIAVGSLDIGDRFRVIRSGGFLSEVVYTVTRFGSLSGMVFASSSEYLWPWKFKKNQPVLKEQGGQKEAHVIAVGSLDIGDRFRIVQCQTGLPGTRVYSLTSRTRNFVNARRDDHHDTGFDYPDDMKVVKEV